MTAPVTVTDRAAERTAQTVSNDPENNMLRVNVEGDGWAGRDPHRWQQDHLRVRSVSDFAFLDDWEDRYRYVIELGRSFRRFPRPSAPTPTRCAAARARSGSPPSRSRRRRPAPASSGDSDAHIVRGLIAILLSIYDGKRADEILGNVAHSHLRCARPPRAFDAAALQRLRRDGRAHPHRRPPRHERRGEGNQSQAPIGDRKGHSISLSQ